TLISCVLLVVASCIGHVRENQLHLGRHAHAIEILLPVAARDVVVNKNNEIGIEWLTPADNYLSVNQPVIDSVKSERHFIVHQMQQARHVPSLPQSMQQTSGQ